MKKAGMLLHISSLPGPYGIGTMGKHAYEFVDFLKRCGQTIWQILPVGPTSYGDSPYSALSAFAANPYFIDLDMLVEEGLLEKWEVNDDHVGDVKVDFGYLWWKRFTILHNAYQRKDKLEKEFKAFKRKNADWLEEYALYMALKHEHQNKPWWQWFDEFKYRKPEALEWAKREYKDKIDEEKFIQFLFTRQWVNLKAYANSQGIKIMGDMPIYCAQDSADVWSNTRLFQLNPHLDPIFVAGCPPDGFTADGQLWGNPLYNYPEMAKDGYSWWCKRLKRASSLFDIVRIDHFRGFAGYYAIPYGDVNARRGHWEKGPGYELFECIERACPRVSIVAENLGFLTDDVEELLDNCGYPGMHIFEFELGDMKNDIPLRNPYQKNNIFYTGTHDNQTIMSWYFELNKETKELIDDICDIKYAEQANLKIIEFVMKSNCDYAIIPFQDYIGLTDEYGRMNMPSTATGNWTYRAEQKWFTKELEDYISNLMLKTKRAKLK